MVALTASPALAKGPDQVTISGPGLSKPIVVSGMGEPGSMDRLGELTNDCALFTAMFGPDPSSDQQFAAQAPTTALGPKYTLAWRVPTGEANPATVRQDLYPWAKDGPLVYTKPGQTSFPQTLTTGGWYRAPGALTTILVSMGVPKHATATGGGAAPATQAPAAPATANKPPAAAPATAGAIRNAASEESTGRTPVALITGGAIVAALLVAGGVLMLRRRISPTRG
jgi:hypothetical protein